jgi:hypothetical protein
MLRAEIELLMVERQQLLQTAGAAAELVAQLDVAKLPNTACGAAKSLAASLNRMDDETLMDAIAASGRRILAAPSPHTQ